MAINWANRNIGHLIDHASKLRTAAEAADFLKEWRNSVDNPHPIAVLTSHLNYYATEYGLPNLNMWADALILAFPIRLPTEQEIALGPTQDHQWGNDLKDIADDMAAKAKTTGQQQRAEFNGRMLVADPGMSGADVAAPYFVLSAAAGLRHEVGRRITRRIEEAGETLLNALEGMLTPFTSKRDEEKAREAAEAAIKKARGFDV